MIVAEGEFEGRGGHMMSGSFRIESSDDGLTFVTSDDFFFDGSPAPGFAFSSSGDATAAEAAASDFFRLPGSGSLTGPQIEVTGRQTSLIPPTIDLSGQKILFLWCYLTPFLLGKGKIQHA